MDVEKEIIVIEDNGKTENIEYKIGEFDKNLVIAGGWVEYADKNY